MNATTTIRGFIGAILAGALCGCSAQGALAPRPDASGQIAFTGFPPNVRVGNLALIRADGSDLRLLPVHAFSPAFSPDGRLMAAVGDTGLSLLVMNADGSKSRTILRWRLMREPAWSPDGTQLAFVCSDSIAGYSTNICVANTDDSGWRQLTIAADAEPRWSWSANEIVAVSGYKLLTIITPDGETVRTLPTPAFSGVTGPTWSADGHALAFVGEKWKLEGDAVMHLDFDSIYLINADGSGLTRLTNGLDAAEPAWSSP